ncbi:MAG: segregation/condensation protein A [Gammaproteobacteria bacterium]|nr:segregation/condensation protein A [Gammaproteobacteria bacterium]MBT3490066.1 segregation/condensation protein A [Gammaproteobacteria bacterium]MBT3719488.1 segregation/condensation protein A [Gammaproteobacteria bacterium]MBT3844000.1 segregation/condensation protein A [Gammaproteobacteria bacterium]MBT3892947.1 segregation/condensation protein A [Gammaproteobacteria bacterium]
MDGPESIAQAHLLKEIRVSGESLDELPKDLYIPPEALKVVLETFEGPLDLLLYLIRRQNLDVLNIPIAEVTRQYMSYVEMMRALNLELAAEYLVMAALLAEIKSRMLLPRHDEIEDEDDPRAELIRRLQEYEQFKRVAEELDQQPRLERDINPVEIAGPSRGPRPQPEVQLQALLTAFSEVLQRAELFNSHHVQREPLSIRERMSAVLIRLEELSTEESPPFIEFQSLFAVEEGRAGVVIALMAVLELIKEALIGVVQNEPYGPIYIGPPSQLSIEKGERF